MALQYRTFGATGLTVPRLCLGTATFGHQADETVAHQIMDTAVEAGVTFFDSSDIYPMGGEVGRTEEIVGSWLQGKRDQIILATKAGGPMGPARWQQGGSRKHLLEAIDGSLRRLGTDYVDIYQLHFDDPDTPLDETLAALDAIVSAGKARYIGVSNFLAYRLARAVGRTETLHLTRIASVQPRYNLLFRQVERELLPLAAETGMAVIPFNPLAGVCSAADTDATTNRPKAGSPHKSVSSSPTCTANGIGTQGHSTPSVGWPRSRPNSGRRWPPCPSPGCSPTPPSPPRSSGPAAPTNSPTPWRPPT